MCGGGLFLLHPQTASALVGHKSCSHLINHVKGPREKHRRRIKRKGCMRADEFIAIFIELVYSGQGDTPFIHEDECPALTAATRFNPAKPIYI